MKKLGRLLISVILCLSTLAIGACSLDDKSRGVLAHEDQKGDPINRISFWYFDDRLLRIIQPFTESNPTIRVDCINVPWFDYLTKLQISLSSGLGTPDVITVESSWQGKVMRMNILENLEADPYCFTGDDILNFSPKWVSNQKGEIVCVPWDLTLAGLAYRKELAREHLGTADSHRLESLMPTWDAFIEQGKGIHEKSGGTLFLFATMGEAELALRGQHATPLYRDGVLYIQDTYARTFDSLLKMRDAGIIDKLVYGSPEWAQSYRDSRYMFHLCAPWSVKWHFEVNDPDDPDAWGLMIPPEGALHYGGTCYAISKSSRNKEIAWKLVQHLTLSEEGGRLAKKICDNYIQYAPLYEDEGYTTLRSSLFGDMALGDKFFEEIAPTIRERVSHPYDVEVQDCVNMLLEWMNRDPFLTTDIVMAKLKEELQAALPNIQIE